jgi:hypothetical protein
LAWRWTSCWRVRAHGVVGERAELVVCESEPASQPPGSSGSQYLNRACTTAPPTRCGSTGPPRFLTEGERDVHCSDRDRRRGFTHRPARRPFHP